MRNHHAQPREAAAESDGASGTDAAHGVGMTALAASSLAVTTRSSVGDVKNVAAAAADAHAAGGISRAAFDALRASPSIGIDAIDTARKAYADTRTSFIGAVTALLKREDLTFIGRKHAGRELSIRMHEVHALQRAVVAAGRPNDFNGVVDLGQQLGLISSKAATALKREGTFNVKTSTELARIELSLKDVDVALFQELMAGVRSDTEASTHHGWLAAAGATLLAGTGAVMTSTGHGASAAVVMAGTLTLWSAAKAFFPEFRASSTTRERDPALMEAYRHQGVAAPI